MALGRAERRSIILPAGPDPCTYQGSGGIPGHWAPKVLGPIRALGPGLWAGSFQQTREIDPGIYGNWGGAAKAGAHLGTHRAFGASVKKGHRQIPYPGCEKISLETLWHRKGAHMCADKGPLQTTKRPLGISQ